MPREVVMRVNEVVFVRAQARSLALGEGQFLLTQGTHGLLSASSVLLYHSARPALEAPGTPLRA